MQMLLKCAYKIHYTWHRYLDMTVRMDWLMLLKQEGEEEEKAEEGGGGEERFPINNDYIF